MRTLPAFLALLLLPPLGAQPPQAEIDPKGLFEKAVQAHGGRDKLAQARADWVKVKGTLVLGDKTAPFVAEMWVQIPGQFKNVVETTTPRGTIRIVQTVNKDRVLTTVDGQPHKTSAAALAEIRETLHLQNVVRLLPVLAALDKYRLDYTGETKIDDRVLHGVKVSVVGHRELRLYFDKESGLLVRTEQMLDDGTGKEFRQETAYLDFRDLGGYKRPVKMAAFRDGKKTMEAELVEVKYYEKFEDSLFVP